MIHTIIGFLSSALIVAVFYLLHRNMSIPRQHLLYFYLLCIFGAVILHSYENMFIWFGFLCLCYACLDDFHQKSIPLFIPVWIALYYFFSDGKTDTLLLPFIFLVFFFIFDLVWDKCVTKKTDILFLFPLTFLLFFEHPFWVAYFVFIIMVLFARISSEKFIGEGDAYMSLPLLFLLEPSWFLSFFLFSLVLALPFATHHYREKRTEEFAFTPYLLGGFLLIYSDNPYISIVILFLSFLATLVLWLWNRKKK